MISSFEPSVALLFGEGAADAVGGLGKDHETLSKFPVTFDKLPEDTQIILLQ